MHAAAATARSGRWPEDFDDRDGGAGVGEQADIDAGRRDGLTSAEREELSQLRRENRRLREDVEILKRARHSVAISGAW